MTVFAVPPPRTIRPGIVTLVAVVLIVINILYVGLSLYSYHLHREAFALLEKARGIFDEDSAISTADFGVINKVLARQTVFKVIFGLVFLAVAIFFFRGYQWARIVLIIGYLLAAAGSVLKLALSGNILHPLLALIVQGAILIAVSFSRDIRSYFELSKMLRLERKRVIGSRST